MKKILYSLVVTFALVTPALAQINPVLTTTPSADITSASATVIPFTAVSGTVSVAGQPVTTRALQRGDGIYIDGEYMIVASSYPNSGLQVPVLRGQLGTTAKPHESASTLVYGPPTAFRTDDIGMGGSLCPATPAPLLVQINVVTGNVWLCRQTSSTVRVWVGTNSRQLTYNSLTVR
jgi:hypothetical protein